MKTTNSFFIRGIKTNNTNIKIHRNKEQLFRKKNHKLSKSSFQAKQPVSIGEKTKLEQKRRVWIITGRVIKIDQRYVYVHFDEGLGVCPWKNVSDFHRRWTELIKEQEVHSFLVVNRFNSIVHFPDQDNQKPVWLLSYKSIHPEEIYNKNKPIPTSSHFLNLAKEFKKKPVPIAESQPFRAYFEIAYLVKQYLKSEQEKIMLQFKKKSLQKITKNRNNNKKIVYKRNGSLNN